MCQAPPANESPRPTRPRSEVLVPTDPAAATNAWLARLPQAQRLAADAAHRAWEMAHGERSTGLELSAAADRARRAAAMLGLSQTERALPKAAE